VDSIIDDTGNNKICNYNLTMEHLNTEERKQWITNILQTSLEMQKGMPTALGILELSPTSILTKLDHACLLNSTGIRKFHDDVAVDIN
jgi:hypothetical protein